MLQCSQPKIGNFSMFVQYAHSIYLNSAEALKAFSALPTLMMMRFL